MLPSQFKLLFLREDQKRALEELRILRLQERVHFLNLGDIAVRQARNAISRQALTRVHWNSFVVSVRRLAAMRNLLRYAMEMNMSVTRWMKRIFIVMKKYLRLQKLIEAAGIIFIERQLRNSIYLLKRNAELGAGIKDVASFNHFKFRQCNQAMYQMLTFAERRTQFRNSWKQKLDLLCVMKLKRGFGKLLRNAWKIRKRRKAEKIANSNRLFAAVDAWKHFSTCNRSKKGVLGRLFSDHKLKLNALQALTDYCTFRLESRFELAKKRQLFLRQRAKHLIGQKWVQFVMRRIESQVRCKQGRRRFAKVAIPRFINNWKRYHRMTLALHSKTKQVIKRIGAVRMHHAIARWIEFVMKAVDRAVMLKSVVHRDGPIPLSYIKKKFCLRHWVQYTQEMAEERQYLKTMDRFYCASLMRRGLYWFQRRHLTKEEKNERISDYRKRFLGPLLCWRAIQQLRINVEDKWIRREDTRVLFRDRCTKRLALWSWKGFKRKRLHNKHELSGMITCRALAVKIKYLKKFSFRVRLLKKFEESRQVSKLFRRLRKLIPVFRAWRDRSPRLHSYSRNALLSLTHHRERMLAYGWVYWKTGLSILKHESVHKFLSFRFNKRRLLRKCFQGLKQHYIEITREYQMGRIFWGLGAQRKWFRRYRLKRLRRTELKYSLSCRGNWQLRLAVRQLQTWKTWMKNNREAKAIIGSYHGQILLSKGMLQFQQHCSDLHAQRKVVSRGKVGAMDHLLKRFFSAWQNKLFRLPDDNRLHSLRAVTVVIDKTAKNHYLDVLKRSVLSKLRHFSDEKLHLNAILRAHRANVNVRLAVRWFDRMMNWMNELRQERSDLVEVEEEVGYRKMKSSLSRWKEYCFTRYQYFRLHTTASLQQARFALHVWKKLVVRSGLAAAGTAGSEKNQSRSSRLHSRKLVGLSDSKKFSPVDYRRSTQIFQLDIAIDNERIRKLGGMLISWSTLARLSVRRELLIEKMMTSRLTLHLRKWKRITDWEKNSYFKQKTISKTILKRCMLRRLKQWRRFFKLSKGSENVSRMRLLKLFQTWKRKEKNRMLLRKIVAKSWADFNHRVCLNCFDEWTKHTQIEATLERILSAKGSKRKKKALIQWRTRLTRVRVIVKELKSCVKWNLSRKKLQVLQGFQTYVSRSNHSRDREIHAVNHFERFSARNALYCMLLARKNRMAGILFLKNSFAAFRTSLEIFKRSSSVVTRSFQEAKLLFLHNMFQHLFLWVQRRKKVRRFRNQYVNGAASRLMNPRGQHRSNYDKSLTQRNQVVVSITEEDCWHQDYAKIKVLKLLRKLVLLQNQQQTLMDNCDTHRFYFLLQKVVRKFARRRKFLRRRRVFESAVLDSMSESKTRRAFQILDLCVAHKWAENQRLRMVARHSRTYLLQRGLKALRAGVIRDSDSETSGSIFSLST